MAVKVKRNIELNQPVLLAAWPGMGNVALGAINYLRKKLDMVEFAEIDLAPFYQPDAITVEDGLGKLPRPPRSVFYARTRPALVVLENDSQFGGEDGVKFAKLVLDFAQKLGVTQLYTAAAFPIPSSYKDRSRVYGAGNTSPSRDRLQRFKALPMEEGTISGLNGLLLGYAQERGIEATCLLATMPIYATNFINPRAWKALVETFQEILKVRVDFTELDTLITEIDSKMEQLESHFRTMLGGKEQEEEEESGVSQQVLNRIEGLFDEAKTSRERAMELKRELDKWGLFEMFEDRFLDLFKKE
jgi:predicted ATP-grasp superfamily ATP-dependent carboligase